MEAKAKQDAANPSSKGAVERITVLSYNLWNTEHLAEREAALERFFSIYDSDIICLQEVRPATLALLDKYLPNHARISELNVRFVRLVSVLKASQNLFCCCLILRLPHLYR